MDCTKDIRFGRVAPDYARHRAGFPDELFRRLEGFGIGNPNERALDLGTGTGTIARAMAARGARVVGLDPDPDLLAEARRLARAAGVAVRYVVGRAERTGLPDADMDVVFAGQCWHWFDRPAEAREVARVLIPGGALVIAHFDWLPLPGNVAAATEALIQAHNPAWRMGGGTGLYPQWLVDVGEAGFEAVETFSFDMEVPYSHDAWRGRVRASAGVGATLPAPAVAAFDGALADLLAARFPADPLEVPHRTWALVCRKPWE